MKKLEIEFILKTSKKLLYNRISTASGLSDWFANDVSINNGIFTFSWNEHKQTAKVVSKKKNEHIKFQWEENKNKYLEFVILSHEISLDLSLIITDFIEIDEEKEELEDLWENQISTLKRKLGIM